MMDLDSASTMWQALPEVREGGRPACAAQVGKLVGGVKKVPKDHASRVHSRHDPSGRYHPPPGKLVGSL